MQASKIVVSLLAAGSLLGLSWNSNAVTIVGSGGGAGPDCDGAAASLGVIWPPNHSMVPETIFVNDLSGQDVPITITIQSIWQDEPVETDGSGNTEPDGSISADGSTAYVRAERAGPGTGRYYFITFTATDEYGSCTGTLKHPPYVPHDQGQGFVPTDTGLRYDSLTGIQVVD